MTSNPSAGIPDEPPPSYDAATAPQTHLAPPSSGQQSYRVRNGIPPEYRRSMEDEGRPLPSGWVRQYDTEHHHQFFVDTNKDPPRSIWHHPYDDDQYMNTLAPNDRQKIKNSLRVPNPSDIAAESSDEDHPSPTSHTGPSPTNPTHPSSSSSSSSHQPSQPPPKQSFGRKMKDKLTQTTHAQREEQRRQRAIAEQQAYERHRQIRQAMVTAMNTGQPQFIGKDRDGRDLYIEPSQTMGHQMPRGGFGYNPYTQGPYANPNARFLRPANPYQRPFGGGYGGGMGLPLMGGLMGGLLIGDLAMGGF